MSLCITRTVDSEGRIVLPPEFIGKTVTVNVVSESEIPVPGGRRRARPLLAELMSQVTEENLPEKVDFGAPVGEEQL